MQASVCGDLESISRLVASGAEIDEANSLHETALTYAIVWNQVDAVELLLQSGADPEAPKESPWSPLMYAANEGNHVIAETLLRNGADRRRLDDHGRSASAIARDRGFDAVARMIAPDADLG
jgi:ankyrin repeat protein